jgi:hypothetical protein
MMKFVPFAEHAYPAGETQFRFQAWRLTARNYPMTAKSRIEPQKQSAVARSPI